VLRAQTADGIRDSLIRNRRWVEFRNRLHYDPRGGDVISLQVAFLVAKRLSLNGITFLPSRKARGLKFARLATLKRHRQNLIATSGILSRNSPNAQEVVPLGRSRSLTPLTPFQLAGRVE
jgi:hypothetical protein